MDFDDSDDEDWWQHVPAHTLRAALTLSQTVWWVDSESSPYFVDSMSPAHRDAVINYVAPHSRSLLLDVQKPPLKPDPAMPPPEAAKELRWPDAVWWRVAIWG